MQLSFHRVPMMIALILAVSVSTAMPSQDLVPSTDASLTIVNTTTMLSHSASCTLLTQLDARRPVEAAIPSSPISQGIISGDHLYVSGFLPLAPVTGEIVGKDDVVAQTLAVLTNVQTFIESVGSNLGKVVKVTLYLRNIEDYETVNAVYATFFGTHRPARSAVAAANIPLGVLVEIDAVVRM
ncbi:Endoribonuclease L-PSP/chorismate mutase-like protein [Lyophyllum atratum]|nr:Endoribonuclease L-PSP/chorismate mutase-like protein [Lyophyllum atratum]